MPSPVTPGNGPRDCRQAGIGAALPDIALGPDRDGVAAALIVAHQHGPDLEVAFAAFEIRRNPYLSVPATPAPPLTAGTNQAG
jgi:hypothetical protein